MKIRDLQFGLSHGWLSFHFGSGDDFQEALALIKQIDLRERNYDMNDNHRWDVKDTPENRVILAEAFENFDYCYDLLMSQGILFRGDE